MLASRELAQIHPTNLRIHDVLKKQGYRTHFWVSGDHRAYENLRDCYGPGVDIFRDGLDPTNEYTTNDDRNMINAVRQLPAFDGTPGFVYFHFMSAHETGVLQPEAQQWPHPKARPPLSLHRGMLIVPADSHDKGTLQADLHLRRLFAALESRGYLQDAIVAITADHGQSLEEHDIVGHRTNLHEPELRVPLYLVDPQRGKRGPLPPFASQIDIGPTVSDLLGLPVPVTWAGRSLLRQPRKRAFFTCSSTFPWSSTNPESGFIEPTATHCWKFLYRP
ncbi:MAG: sulfatase-like hydrolase/transferase [Candidatus Synoicihabitans palmerolidicus]|nr:sulfatase-like hydrolase/transferase [Candidatus Synoicihabitans palmerolidicus]